VLLGLVTALGLLVRLWAVLVDRPTCVGDDDPLTTGCYRLVGDALYFFGQGEAIADSRGFVAPFLTSDVPSSSDPPAFAVLVAALHAVGIDTPHGQRLVLTLVGAAGVGLIALAAHRFAGVTAAAAAGVLAAIDPNLWINDGMVMSEGLLVPLIAVVLLTALRAWQHPTVGRAAALGAALGFAALTRGEALAYNVLIVVPLLVGLRTVPLPRRVALVAVAWTTCLLVVAPWFAYNASRFEHLVLMTSSTGSVLLSGTCAETYEGELLGYHHGACFEDTTERWLEASASGDESERDAAFREIALDHMRANGSRVPVVAAARAGRVWGVYRPGDSVQLDAVVENRPEAASRVGYVAHLAMIPLSVAGLVVLRRRRLPISPFVGIAVSVTATAAAAMGVTRYRLPWDVCAVVLTAVAFDAVVSWWRARQSGERRPVAHAASSEAT
jgi:hypothetical protein